MLLSRSRNLIIIIAGAAGVMAGAGSSAAQEPTPNAPAPSLPPSPDASAPQASPGAAALDRKELQRIPGTGNDIVRSLTAMPGVVNLQIPLGYLGVVIRGSSPQDSKVLVDDFEIPVLFHNIGFRALLPAE